LSEKFEKTGDKYFLLSVFFDGAGSYFLEGLLLNVQVFRKDSNERKL